MNHLYVSGTEIVPENKLGTRGASDNTSSTDYLYESREHFNKYYDTSDAINQRIFVGGGIGFVFFDRLEVGAMGRYGYGYRYFSDDFTGTNIRSLEVNMKWLLK